jgi:hypothetical protein
VREVVEIVNVEFSLPTAVNVTLVGLRLVLGECPPLGETEEDRLTVPAKPLRLVSVMFAAFEAPGKIATEEMLEAILKPTTLVETVANRVSLALLPKILTVYVLGVDALNVAVELALPPADRVTLAGLNVTVTPAGVDVALRVTVPANPFRLFTVTVEVVVEPALKLTLAGLEETLKSVIVMVSVKTAERVFVKPVVLFVTV